MRFLPRELPPAYDAALGTFAFLKGFLGYEAADKGHIMNMFLG